MNEFKYMEKLESESSSKKKMELLSAGMTERLEKYLRLTFGDVVLNVAGRTIENALDIKTSLKFKDIGGKVEWWLKNKTGQASLIAFTDETEEKEATFDDFLKFFDEIQNYSGKELERQVKDFLETCDPVSAKWYSRCLVKNLACGVSYTTVNKVFKEKKLEPIETFDVSLCEKIECPDENTIRTELGTIMQRELYDNGAIVDDNPFLEPKYDGVRMIVRNCNMLRKKNTEALSRNGKKIETVNFLLNEFDRVFGGRLMELDGELVARDFQTLMTQMHRKNDLNVALPREYMVFDILSLDGNDMTYLPYSKRRDILEGLFNEVDNKTIKLVKNKRIRNIQEVVDMYNKSVNAGYEGVIVKLDRPYTKDRKHWWKMKPVNTADLKIAEANKDGSGRHAGKVSSFMVTDASGRVYSKVGSGLKDAIIDEINNDDTNKLIGKIVEVMYDSTTKPDEKGIKALRFPRFIQFRDDKNEPDEI